jgi:pimeloyl-ACP methyl ester carboxylesterase
VPSLVSGGMGQQHATGASADDIRSPDVRTRDITFSVLEVGSGPLALCLHGFPDTARTWRHLLPELADAGFHAVAPFMRGYAPTGLPDDGCYSLGALARDANMLHEALDGDGRAVLIGHDWGAEAAYPAAASASDRWARLVTLSVPPAALDDVLFRDYEQLKNFFYLFALREAWAEDLVSADGMNFLRRLWADWSPGYGADEDLEDVRRALADRAHLAAAIGYYRDAGASGASKCSAYAVEDAAVMRTPPQPTLYLHGARDGCVASSWSLTFFSTWLLDLACRSLRTAGIFCTWRDLEP